METVERSALVVGSIEARDGVAGGVVVLEVSME